MRGVYGLVRMAVTVLSSTWPRAHLEGHDDRGQFLACRRNRRFGGDGPDDAAVGHLHQLGDQTYVAVGAAPP